MRPEDATPERVTVAVLVLVALLFVVALVVVSRSFADIGPRQDPCDEARASANAVPQREDTVEDEVEYRRLDARADEICAAD